MRFIIEIEDDALDDYMGEVAGWGRFSGPEELIRHLLEATFDIEDVTMVERYIP